MQHAINAAVVQLEGILSKSTYLAKTVGYSFFAAGLLTMMFVTILQSCLKEQRRSDTVRLFLKSNFQKNNQGPRCFS